jgi:hypothetical protein
MADAVAVRIVTVRSDREVDALVVEHIMGWKVKHALPAFSTDPKACAKLKAHVRKSHREWIIETTEAAAGVTVAVWATADDLIRGLGATAATQSDTIERATCTVLLRCYGIDVEHAEATP